MAITYQKFLKENISLEQLGVLQRTDHEPYFCTPRGASIIGWAGADGIHYCRIRGFGEMVFAVSPMNGVGEYVHPLAENFEDFLRLLLVCKDAGALEQAWQWEEAVFWQFLKDHPVTEQGQMILNQITAQLHLLPMEHAWQYLNRLQSSFDYSKIKYTEEYEELIGIVPETKSDWKVTFSDEDGTRERAGKEIKMERWFEWADHQWLIPSIYLCSKGLVIDFCMKIEQEKIWDFMKKWDLTVENEEEKQFTKEEEMLLKLENPLTFSFRPHVILNGKELFLSHGRGSSHNPCVPEGCRACRTEQILDHYGLDRSCGWMFWRSYTAWNTVRKPKIKTLEIMMEQQKIRIPGERFCVRNPGEQVNFIYPENGTEYTLTVQEYEPQELNMEHMNRSDFEYPTHYQHMVYTIEPEMKRGWMTLSDCSDGDRPLQKIKEPYAPTAAASIAIIGGADGPTAIFSGENKALKHHGACSSLHFEPVQEVEWQMIFHEKKYGDGTIKLI